MARASFHILRVGLAITFLWIGILIIRDPASWGGYLEPWASRLLPIPLKQAMLGTALMDLCIGILLLVDTFVWFAGLLGAIHIIIVLAVSGITDITVRDIAILAASLAVMLEALPKTLRDRLRL